MITYAFQSGERRKEHFRGTVGAPKGVSRFYVDGLIRAMESGTIRDTVLLVNGIAWPWTLERSNIKLESKLPPGTYRWELTIYFEELEPIVYRSD